MSGAVAGRWNVAAWRSGTGAVDSRFDVPFAAVPRDSSARDLQTLLSEFQPILVFVEYEKISHHVPADMNNKVKCQNYVIFIDLMINYHKHDHEFTSYFYETGQRNIFIYISSQHQVVITLLH